MKLKTQQQNKVKKMPTLLANNNNNKPRLGSSMLGKQF